MSGKLPKITIGHFVHLAAVGAMCALSAAAVIYAISRALSGLLINEEK